MELFSLFCLPMSPKPKINRWLWWRSKRQQMCTTELPVSGSSPRNISIFIWHEVFHSDWVIVSTVSNRVLCSLPDWIPLLPPHPWARHPPPALARRPSGSPLRSLQQFLYFAASRRATTHRPHRGGQLLSEAPPFPSLNPGDGTLSCFTDWPLPTGEWQVCIRGWGLPQSLMIGCWMELRWMEHMPKEQDSNPSEGEEKQWVGHLIVCSSVLITRLSDLFLPWHGVMCEWGFARTFIRQSLFFTLSFFILTLLSVFKSRDIFIYFFPDKCFSELFSEYLAL